MLITNIYMHMFPLKYRSNIYDACIRPVLLYGGETWALTHKLVEMLVRNENKMEMTGWHEV